MSHSLSEPLAAHIRAVAKRLPALPVEVIDKLRPIFAGSPS